MSIKEEFLKFNIDVFGICDAAPYNEAMGTDYGVCIVALFPYYNGYSDGSNISIYTHGRDYHLVTKDILTRVADSLGLRDYRIHSDIGPDIERTLCVNAGLAFRGKNGMCINDKYGSYFFIGYIACKEQFPLDTPNTGKCLDCGRCISACPGGAISDGFDISRCLSDITQKRGEITPYEEKLIKKNKTVFGCDICQRVCPHNADVPITPIREFKENTITRIDIEDIETLSQKQFARLYGDRAFAWRGKNVIMRNLKLMEEEK